MDEYQTLNYYNKNASFEILKVISGVRREKHPKLP